MTTLVRATTTRRTSTTLITVARTSWTLPSSPPMMKTLSAPQVMMSRVDREHGGHLVAGVVSVPPVLSYSHSNPRRRIARCTKSVLLSIMFAYLFSFYFANSSISCDVPMGKDFQDLLLHQVEESGGGQRDSATLPTAKQ